MILHLLESMDFVNEIQVSIEIRRLAS